MTKLSTVCQEQYIVDDCFGMYNRLWGLNAFLFVTVSHWEYFRRTTEGVVKLLLSE